MIHFNHLLTVLMLLMLMPGVYAQTPEHTDEVTHPELRRTLLDMEMADQAIRTEFNEKGLEQIDSLDVARMHNVDTTHREHLKRIITKHGWPTVAMVGLDGVKAALLIVQHADLDPAFQRDMLPYITRSHEAGVLSGQDVALLTDRVLTNEGRPQRYGTQVEIKDGEVVVQPLEHPEQVDQRRARMGLPPMADYLRMLKEFYGLNKENP